MSRITAPDRLRRVLAIVPWIVANPGHSVLDVAARFGLTEKALLDDLAVVYMVGLPPYSPDALVEVVIDEDGCVSIDLAEFFSRPLKLTPGQGLALLAASDAFLSVPGVEEDGSLARALTKLGATLGVVNSENRSTLDVQLGDVEERVLVVLKEATADCTDVVLDYYSFGRDSMSTRRVSPWRVFSDSGAWYVHGWCNKAQGERVFRLDRIASIEPTSDRSEHQPSDEGTSTSIFHPRPDDPRIRLRLSSSVAWVVEAYPCETVEHLENGDVEVSMVITAEAWLFRLLLRLGPDCEILDASSLGDVSAGVAAAASKILDRYSV